MNVTDYKRVYSNKYYRIVGRVVRNMEKDVKKLLGDHPQMSINTAWDVVIAAYRQADRTVGGGYGR